MQPRGHALYSAKEDFHRARRQATLEQVMNRLRGEPTTLLPFEPVKRRLKGRGEIERGLQEIPLSHVGGSVGRYRDFTRSFLPRSSSAQHRWAAVKVFMSEHGFEPIQVYKLGDAYFVRDGNHRVSIARQMGNDTIPAYVTEIATRVPMSPGTKPDDMIRQVEHANFLEETKLDVLRPEGSFDTTLPGRYDVLINQIHGHRRWLQEQGRDVTLPEAAADWFDRVYLPAIHIIRTQGILRDFADRTETDLYVWIVQHRDQLREELGWDVAVEDAAQNLAEQESQQPDRVASRVGSRLREALTHPSLESGPPPGTWRRERVEGRTSDALFNDILVAINGVESGWLALEQAIVVARREEARLFGLHVVPTEAEPHGSEVSEMRERFRQRCEEAGVVGYLVVEVGEVVPMICDRSRWTDLVTLPLTYPPTAQLLARLTSSFSVLLRRCPRPLLVVPQRTTGLNSLLLAYDASPKSLEALYVATYLSGTWGVPLEVITVMEDKVTHRALDEAREYIEQHGVVATYHDKTGRAADAILRHAEEQQSELLVMGGYGHSSVREVVVGGTVDQLLREARRPMLICR